MKGLRQCWHEQGTNPAVPVPRRRGPLRRSWAILRPRFSWSGPDSPENVQNRPLTASGPSDGTTVGVAAIRCAWVGTRGPVGPIRPP